MCDLLKDGPAKRLDPGLQLKARARRRYFGRCFGQGEREAIAADALKKGPALKIVAARQGGPWRRHQSSAKPDAGTGPEICRALPGKRRMPELDTQFAGKGAWGKPVDLPRYDEDTGPVGPHVDAPDTPGQSDGPGLFGDHRRAQLGPRGCRGGGHGRDAGAQLHARRGQVHRRSLSHLPHLRGTARRDLRHRPVAAQWRLGLRLRRKTVKRLIRKGELELTIRARNGDEAAGAESVATLPYRDAAKGKRKGF